jgi:protein TonB
MARRPATGGAGLAATPGAPTALGLSIALHVALLAWIVIARAPAPRVGAPVYRVDLVAAPPGPRAEGVVTPAPPASPPARPAERPAAKPPVPVSKAPPTAMPLPAKAAPKRPAPVAATPVPSGPAKAAPAKAPAAAPRAGGGPSGGQGADVATVHTEGIEFPYPGYLENIVRQIALRFNPPRNVMARAEIRFMIHRDGSAQIVGFVQKSGNFEFDLEAQGAVEAAGRDRAFTPLPREYPADVLTVVFSFDPRTIR